MNIYVIRHGRTEANEKHLYCGSTDLSLSESGKKDLIEKKKRTDYPDPGSLRVVTSGMKRCEETMQILFGNIRHEQNMAFCEMDFGRFEMHSYTELSEDADYLEWITGDNESKVTPGGESGKLMTERALRGLDSLIRDGRDVLLITHGGVVAVIMAYLFPEEQKNRYEWQPEPGGGYWIDTRSRTYTAI